MSSSFYYSQKFALKETWNWEDSLRVKRIVMGDIKIVNSKVADNDWKKWKKY